VTEECKEQHGRGKVRGRKEDQVQVRRHKVPPRERTEIQCTKPGNLKGKKLQQDAVGRRTTLKRFVLVTHCNTSGPSRIWCLPPPQPLLSHIHIRVHMHIHMCIHTPHIYTCTHTHIHTQIPMNIHTHTPRGLLCMSQVPLLSGQRLEPSCCIS